jgi:hypothetical protein
MNEQEKHQAEPAGAGFWKWEVNVPLLAIAVLATVLGAKVLTLLPEEYYFGFAKLVGFNGGQEFLVTPPLVERELYGEILERAGYRGYRGFVEEGASLDAPPVRLSDQEREARISAINDQIAAAGLYHFWTSLALKMAPPFVVGLLMFAIVKQAATRVAPLGAGIAAFLLAWPVIALWDTVVNYGWTGQRYLFFILYVAYIALYYHLARLGCYTAGALLRVGVLKAGQVEIDLGKIVSSLISTGITVAVTWVVTTSIARA